MHLPLRYGVASTTHNAGKVQGVPNGTRHFEEISSRTRVNNQDIKQLKKYFFPISYLVLSR